VAFNRSRTNSKLSSHELSLHDSTCILDYVQKHDQESHTLKITTSVCTFQNFKTSSSTTLQYLCPKRTPRGDGTLVPSAIHLDFLTSLAFRRCNNDKLGKLNIPPPDRCCRQIPENDLELRFSEDLGNSYGKSTNELYFWKSALQTRMVFVSAPRTGAVYIANRSHLHNFQLSGGNNGVHIQSYTAFQQSRSF